MKERMFLRRVDEAMIAAMMAATIAETFARSALCTKFT